MATISPDLGALSVLPLELRDRVYSHVLNFNTPPDDYCPRHRPILNRGPRTSLLRVSRRIHDESIICMYQVNEFGFWVEKDVRSSSHKNTSIMGRPGYWIYFGHNTIYQERLDESFFEPPKEMISHLQNVALNIGTQGGLREFDIVPAKRQMTVGPERPTFRPLLKKVEEVCRVLKECKNIHVFRLSIRSVEKMPGSIEQVLDPVRKLRGIKRTHPVVYAMQEDQWVDWNMKGSYGRYLNKIMGMPEGGEAPKYIGDEKDPNQSEDDIFDMIGGRWMGGRTFAYPGSDDFDDSMEEDWSEADEFNEFFDEMFNCDFDDMHDVDSEDDENEEESEEEESNDDDEMPDLVEIGDHSYPVWLGHSAPPLEEENEWETAREEDDGRHDDYHEGLGPTRVEIDRFNHFRQHMEARTAARNPVPGRVLQEMGRVAAAYTFPVGIGRETEAEEDGELSDAISLD